MEVTTICVTKKLKEDFNLKKSAFKEMYSSGFLNKYGRRFRTDEDFLTTLLDRPDLNTAMQKMKKSMEKVKNDLKEVAQHESEMPILSGTSTGTGTIAKASKGKARPNQGTKSEGESQTC